MTTTFVTHSTKVTVPTTGIITHKIVADVVPGEDAAKRHKRLAYQGGKKVNDARVTNLGNGSFSVESQRKDENGKPLDEYGVAWTGTMWLCQCQFGIVNPGVECTHVARVREYASRNKLTFGAEAVKEMKVESERVTDSWIERSKASRKVRYEHEEEI